MLATMVAQRRKTQIMTISLLLVLVLFNSCGSLLTPRGVAQPLIHPTNPIIIIPGMMGSTLRNPDTDEIVWGRMIDLRVANPHEALLFPEKDGVELPVDSTHSDGLIASSILSRFEMLNRIGSVTVYEDLIQNFSRCGLVEGDIQRCSGSDNIYLFSYDWRQDLVKTAQLLADRIEAVKLASGPETQVTLVTHSMGGLVAQYYLMYGGKDILSDSTYTPDYSGVPSVDKVFFLGTPFKGTPMAFKSLHGGEWIGPGLTISNWATFTMPAIYEMLPFSDDNLFIDDQNHVQSLDLIQANTWKEMGFSIFQKDKWSEFEQTCQTSFPNSGPEFVHDLRQQYEVFFQSALDRGVSFQGALSQIEWERISSEIFVVAGNCQGTLEQIRLIENGSQKQVQIVESRFINEYYWLDNQGDGIVLASSADEVELTANQILKGCFRHRTMPNQKEVLQFILENL